MLGLCDFIFATFSNEKVFTIVVAVTSTLVQKMRNFRNFVMKNWKILILKEKIQFYNFNIGHKGHTIIEIFPLNQKKSFHPFVFCLFAFSTFHLSSVHFLNFFFFCVLKCYDVTDHCMISYGRLNAVCKRIFFFLRMHVRAQRLKQPFVCLI